MIPRGEVGLIFASIGLTNGVLDDDLYAALAARGAGHHDHHPPAIRVRIGRRTRGRAPATTASAPPAAGSVVDGTRARPPGPGPTVGLAVALEAARLVADHDPDAGPRGVDGRAGRGRPSPGAPRPAPPGELLAAGNRRSWRLLDATGLLAAALPGLADEIDHRRRDTTLLDPAHLMRLPIVERLAELIGPDGDERARTEAALPADPRRAAPGGARPRPVHRLRDAAVAPAT